MEWTKAPPARRTSGPAWPARLLSPPSRTARRAIPSLSTSGETVLFLKSVCPRGRDRSRRDDVGDAASGLRPTRSWLSGRCGGGSRRSTSCGSWARRRRTRPGEIGALLRREGLYSGHLSKWRRQRDAGALEALGRPRGRKPVDRRDLELAQLRRRAERAEAELQKARKVIEIQGNVSALLEQMLGTEGASGHGSTGR